MNFTYQIICECFCWYCFNFYDNSFNPFLFEITFFSLISKSVFFTKLATSFLLAKFACLTSILFIMIMISSNFIFIFFFKFSISCIIVSFLFFYINIFDFIFNSSKSVRALALRVVLIAKLVISGILSLIFLS